jgi:seryl-tRNA synthetase
MIDPKILRQQSDKARAGLQNRGGRYVPALDEWLVLDAEHRKVLAQVEEKRTLRNALSQKIGAAKAAKNEAEAKSLMEQVGALKSEAAGLEEQLPKLAAQVESLALGLPNLPHESTPLGKSEADNPVVRTGKAPAKMDFKPLDHQGLGEKLGLLDLPAAAKLSGSRFALWKDRGAKLLRAIINFQLELHTGKHGYVEYWPPYLVRPQALEGTGQLPKFEADLYKTSSSDGDKAQDLFLIPTAEVPLTNLVRESILDAAALPMRMTAYTPCFRQEAGSYGKDVRGVIRNHQFDKVELVWITKPEDSLEALEKLTGHAEAVLTALELPHRVIALCTADIGFSSRKTYDVEIWMPSEGRYREISSCSDCGDFQARRMGARFRREQKAPPEFVHTLNGSGVAVGRLAAALLENGQQADGSVRLPAALAPYFGGDTIAA